MNATCPRCGTVTLIGAQTRRVMCKTCRLRFCRECQHWKTDRQQNYCASCGVSFNIPPSAIPASILAMLLYVPLLFVIVTAPLARTTYWPAVLIAILLPLVYTWIYLAVFYRHTGLARATRREAALLVRRTVMLATLAYIARTLNTSGVILLWLAAAVTLVLIGLAIRRTDASVIQELQANRHAWEAILSMPNRDALLMRFPYTRATR